MVELYYCGINYEKMTVHNDIAFMTRYLLDILYELVLLRALGLNAEIKREEKDKKHIVCLIKTIYYGIVSSAIFF